MTCLALSWESVDKPLTSRGYGAGAEMYTSAALTLSAGQRG